MSQHATDACDEGNGTWLPLIEYSVRSGISTSTIRRKIKSNAIRFRLDNGRYMIFYPGQTKQASQVVREPKPLPKPTPIPAPRELPVKAKSTPMTPKIDAGHSTLPFVDQAIKMVSEAFEKTLKEKDERIRLLEKRNEELTERMNELRILVQALEEKYQVRY